LFRVERPFQVKIVYIFFKAVIGREIIRQDKKKATILIDIIFFHTTTTIFNILIDQFSSLIQYESIQSSRKVTVSNKVTSKVDSRNTSAVSNNGSKSKRSRRERKSSLEAQNQISSGSGKTIFV